MRFQQTNRTPYLSRRDQTRLAIMVCMIGVLVFAIDFAARPASWYWLTGNPEATQDSKKSEQTTKPTKIDFRPNVDEPSLGPEVIRVVGGKSPEDADRYRPQNVDGGSVESEAATANDAEHILTLSPELTGQIKDNSVGLRESERELYYYLLAKTRDVPPTALDDASRDDVAFAVLMAESKDFLGKLITVKGEIRRLTPLPPGRNDFGIQQLWEAWLFNSDSGINPYCIRMTSIPEGIPTGMDLGSGNVVRVTGYFFKRYGYPAQQDRLHVAPLILAKSVHWFKPRSASKPTDLGLVPYVLVFAGGLGSVIAILLWRFRSSDRNFERKHLKRLTAAPEGAIAAISDIPTIELEESLRQMSAQAANEAAERIEPARSPDEALAPPLETTQHPQENQESPEPGDR